MSKIEHYTLYDAWDKILGDCDVPTIHKLAEETWNKNTDTLVARFLLEHPDIKSDQVELVMNQEINSIIFSIREKE